MKKYRCVGISECDYHENCEFNMGWCPDCSSFTRDCTEPDAEGYDCPECGKMNVVGTEQALLLGWIDITEEDEEGCDEEEDGCEIEEEEE